jgi:hypothetical protein
MRDYCALSPHPQPFSQREKGVKALIEGEPLCWPRTCSSLMGDADKHRDFVKRNRETVMTKF